MMVALPNALAGSHAAACALKLFWSSSGFPSGCLAGTSRALEALKSSRKRAVPAGSVAWYTVEPSLTLLVLTTAVAAVFVQASCSDTPPLTIAPTASPPAPAGGGAEVIVKSEWALVSTIGACTWWAAFVARKPVLGAGAEAERATAAAIVLNGAASDPALASQPRTASTKNALVAAGAGSGGTPARQPVLRGGSVLG